MTTMRMRTNSLPSRLALATRLCSRYPLGFVAVLSLFVCVGESLLEAQAKPAIRHTVDGKVVDGAKAPVAGAVVYLENPKSLDVQSYLTDDGGNYHFTHIAAQTDYELWAEQNGVQTKHKFISQFSNHVAFHFTLKLTPQKKKKFLGIF